MAGLDEPSRSPDNGEQAFGTVDASTLLAWAEENGLSPQDALMEALRRGIIPSRYSKNHTALTLEEQRRVCGGTVLVCGCGGLGGIIVQLLARAGVGRLRLVDGDVFAESNMNRQLLSDGRVLSQPKVRVAEHTVHVVDPFVVVEAVPEVLTTTNCRPACSGDRFGDGCVGQPRGTSPTVVGRDRKDVRGPVRSWCGGWLVGSSQHLHVDSVYDLSSMYGLSGARDAAEQGLGVLGPVAATIGSMQALEALRILCGWPPAYRDHLLYFDGESGRIEVVPLKPANLG